jgi:hypothetical protein
MPVGGNAKTAISLMALDTPFINGLRNEPGVNHLKPQLTQIFLAKAYKQRAGLIL